MTRRDEPVVEPGNASIPRFDESREGKSFMDNFMRERMRRLERE